MTKVTFQLCQDQIKHWKQEGFLLLTDFLTEDEKLIFLNAAKEISNWPEKKSSYMHYYEKKNGERILCRTENFTPYHQKISDILKSQKLNKLLSDLLKFEASRENRHLNAQDDKVFLFKEKINYKLAGAAGFPAHQDAPAFMQLGEPMHVSMMIAVDEATKENGCLEVVRGSHLSNILPQMEDGSIHEDWCKDKLWEPVTCKPGDCLIFGSYLAHRSGPNNSSKNRSAFYFTFNDQNSGDLRESYYNEKREKFPPMIDRIDGKDYSNGAKTYNLATPIENEI